VDFGIPKSKIKVQIDEPYYVKPVTKKPHSSFNILYYMPTKPANLGGMKYLKWLYGWDVYSKIKLYFEDNKNINFIWISGQHDMTKVYPTVDLYIRPTRHDGESRLIMECDINSIPYVFSRDGKPNASEFINAIKREYEKKFR
jgi:hypothetical protein